PEDTEPGILPITVTDDEDPEVTATEHLTVTDEDGVVQLGIIVDPDEVPAGEPTTVTGQGYTPDSTATVQLRDQDGNPVGEPVEDVPTSEDGTFEVSLPTPEDAEPGDYTVAGVDDTTGEEAT
ncbi:hypothetical protein, partial [Nesterenkonia sp. K-15-9-6]|uniref:hypothetical protein n=1 Tax=Nesterenkonia sp. K-15-9-6 TaxID=3093918 RepID=UPI004043DEDB